MGRRSDDKKSFQLYNDYIKQVSLLPDDEAGKLFKAILAYANGQNVGELEGLAMMAFSFIQAQMDRDREKYDERCAANRENGRLGGRPRREELKPDGFSENHSVLFPCGQEGENPADMGGGDNPPAKKVKAAYSTDFEAFWRAYPRHDDKGQAYKKYMARLRDGYKPEELCRAASNYRAKCQRDRTEQKFIKQAKTFLGDATPFVDYLDKKAAGGGSVDERMRTGANPFRQ